MAGQTSSGKKPMGVGGVQQYGSATGKPESTSSLKTGGDLRAGGKKK